MTWVLVVLVIIGLLAAAIGIVQAVERGPKPPFLVQPPLNPPREARGHEPGTLRLAGSGSNLPLTRALAEAFASTQPDAHVVVHASIGSTGGVRAVHDGVIDIGLVSRELKPQESALGLEIVPHARVAVVFAANPNVPVTGLSRAEVVAAYSGERQQWPDGSAVVVLQREEGDSSHLVAAQALDGFAEADRASLDAGRWRVLYRDSAMHDALVSTAGAIGLIDLGAAVSQDLDLRVLALDGVQPSERTVSDGSYPMSKRLAFVLPSDGGETADAFVRFVFSPAGQEITRRNGYIPLAAEDRP